MESTELQEGLFKAIQTIAKSEVNKMSFDKTLVCTITNADNASKGEYKVTDGVSSPMTAYSEVISYKVGEQVLVKVPNGDFNNQKHIEGKYIAADSGDTYISPTIDFIPYTDNLITNPGTEGRLLTNYKGTKFKNVPETDINLTPEHSETVLWKANVANTEGYDFTLMYLAADFKTLIGSNNRNNIQLKSGYYGIKLQMDMSYLDMDKNKVTNKNVTFYLDSTDMNGNIYDFETYYKQEKVFQIEDKYIKDGLMISNVKVSFFQGDSKNSTVFKNLSDELVPWYGENEGTKFVLDPNLFATNVELKFGYKEEKVDNDKIVLAVKKEKGGYGSEGQNSNALKYYSYLPEDEKTRLKNKGYSDWYIEENYDKLLAKYNQKTIYINKEKSFIELLNKYKHEPDEINLKIELYQYMDPKYGDADIRDYSASTTSSSSEAGENWVQIKPDINDGLNVSYTFSPDISREEEKFKVIAYYESPAGTDEVVDEETGEVLVEDTKHKTLVSNELVFSLVGEIQQKPDNYLVVDCDNDGIFKIYDLKGRLINNFEKYKKRYLYAHKGENTLRSITWRIPYKNSMIEPMSYEEFTEGYSTQQRGYVKNEEEGVIYYTIYSPKETDFYFRIKDYLSSNDINNTIYCTAKFEGGSSDESIAKTIEFCTIDYFGTKYKIDMRFENGNSAIPIGKEQWVQVRVLNAENVDITDTIINQGLTFDLEWYSRSSDSIMTISNIDQEKYRFLLNAEEEIIFGKRISETGHRVRQIEENDNQIRIIEDTVGDQGDLNYTETRVTEKDGEGISYTRITNANEIRRTETNYSYVPDLIKYFGSHIIRATISGFEYRENSDEESEDRDDEMRKLTLIGFFPVPVSSSTSYVNCIGPSQILYDSKGANPAYYKGSPELYYIDSKNVEHQNKNVSWELNYERNGNFKEYELTSPGNILKVPPVIVEGRKCINMLARSASDGSILWIQPIIIQKDMWDDRILNSWKNFEIQSIVTGLGELSEDKKLSGIFLGQAIDTEKKAQLEAEKFHLLQDVQDKRNEITADYLTLDYLYTLPSSPETDAEIDNYVENIIPAHEEELSDLLSNLEDLNAQIEKSGSITGLYGFYKQNPFFRLTEEGEFTINTSLLKLNSTSGIITGTKLNLKNHGSTQAGININNTFLQLKQIQAVDPDDGITKTFYVLGAEVPTS